MNFPSNANEALQLGQETVTWAHNNVAGALMVAAAFTAATGIVVIRLRERLARPTPTGFDNPAIKASRTRSAELFRRLGLPHSEP